MSESSARPREGGVFKWVCLLVVVVALAGFGWMLNDIRLEAKALGQKAERLTAKTEALVDKVDKQLPPLLAQAEKTSAALDQQLPKILDETQSAGKTINTHLPTLLKRTETLMDHTETAVDSLAEVSDSFKQYKGLMSVVHVATQNKGLFSYATNLLGFLGKHDATVGVKAPGSDALKRAVPAKDWAAGAAKDAHLVSVAAKSKADVRNALTRAGSTAPLHIKIGDQPPRPLADWLKESHPESKGE